MLQRVVGVGVGGDDPLERRLAQGFHVLLGEHFEKALLAEPAHVVARRLLAVAEDTEIESRGLEQQGDLA